MPLGREQNAVLAVEERVVSVSQVNLHLAQTEFRAMSDYGLLVCVISDRVVRDDEPSLKLIYNKPIVSEEVFRSAR